MLESVLFEFLQRTSDAVLVIDASDSIIFFNQGAEEVFKERSSTIIGKKLEDLLPDFVKDRRRDPPANTVQISLNEINKHDTFTLAIERWDGSILPVQGRTTVVQDGAGVFTVILMRELQEIQEASAVVDARRKRINSVHRLQTEISKGEDLHQVLTVVVEEIIAQLGADAVCLLKFDEKRKELSFSAGSGFFTDALQHTRLRIGEGNAGRAAAERRILSIKDLRRVKTDFLRSPQFLSEGFVTYHAVPMIANDRLTGVIELFHRTEFTPEMEWLNYLQTLSEQTAVALDNFQCFLELKHQQAELVLACDEIIESWAQSTDVRNRELDGQSRRITELTLTLAGLLGFADSEIANLRRGAILHDIGNIGIPDRILLKPDRLNEEETLIMRQHPLYSRELIYPITFLRPVIDIPYCHHERWDGSGYPRGLKGEEIPLPARIFAVVDVWDALRSSRAYRPAWPREQSLQYILSMSGKLFDPAIVPYFVKIVEE